MSFRSGRVTFCRFAVEGDIPAAARSGDAQGLEKLIDKLSENAFADSAIASPDQVDAGWTAGDHLFDQQFSYEKNAFGGTGASLLFALRFDTHRVPSDIKNAYRMIHEQAAAAQNPSGFASRSQKRQAREEADAQVRDELASGKHRKSKHTPVLWDLSAGMLYCSSTSAKVHEELAGRFRQTFDLELRYLSSGPLAQHLVAASGKSGRDFEDLRPSPFTAPPSSAGSVRDEDQDDATPRDLTIPTVPWTTSALDVKDFLGNEFLIWLWRQNEAGEGIIKVDAGQGSKAEYSIVIDKAIDMDCAWGATGKQSLRAGGPTTLPEAGAALREGKWPRKMSLILSDGEHPFELSLQGDRFQVGSAMLPEIQTANSPRELVEQRLELLRTLGRSLDDLYRTFLKVRLNSSGAGWPTERQRIGEWIKARHKR